MPWLWLYVLGVAFCVIGVVVNDSTNDEVIKVDPLWVAAHLVAGLVGQRRVIQLGGVAGAVQDGRR